ncbi:Histone-lysine N-methyltransferaseH3 lysine-36 specific [Penicillium diatomitis]|uniref:Histone-lysine N-methyltransferase, H3 lysine-36 specific n=1 Tax=Penicillium diatomitis TaxID=2819901 RepID=A0A9W9WKG5_9EURO|nr:Histone-lysine N-methyltransferaseH3 lysine-36 specific [Penicillium diatomitis]KAJ5466709.1 Histone-lysine N-methyltransferaseH3 lysine-36 specific [Penicillium diatomitis]
MSAHDNADSQDPEPSVKMESRFANGRDPSSHINGPLVLPPQSPSSQQKHESPVDANSPIHDPETPLSSDLMLVKREHNMKPETVGGDIVVKEQPGQPPKLARSSSQKVVPRPPRLFSHLPDSTKDALATFEQIEACWYANKNMGYTEHAMECDCAEEWDAEAGLNQACGEDSDCINRATKIECVGDCDCGPDCRNQRFQKREYAPVAVIKTEKKGFGLRAEADLDAHQLIFEYVGEVVGESQFRRRMKQYDEEGIKHFYFMSLNRNEFVDATRRGNLGRFCNHSCNPNCYVDKWVVGEKFRMGIFAQRSIRAGEELVFDYNVDRYGTEPQPCYCGEPNCEGFIGGRTQTEQATKLSNATIEALGIDDADGWDTAVTRRPRKKKSGERDEEYVDSVEPKSLEEDAVTKVMAALMQCKEKWIAVKLLSRLQRCADERVRNRVIKMHGYQILNSQLAMWKEDANVLMQILDILDQFPRLTRNKIVDSKIETNIQPLTTHEDERVADKAAALLASWANLEVAYRIPRMKRGDQQVKPTVNQFERRESGREQQPRPVSRSPPPVIPTGPAARGHGPGPHRRDRHMHHHGGFGPGGGGRPRRDRRNDPRNRQPLPEGWFIAEAEGGRVYYYSAAGETTWTRPTVPPPSATAPATAVRNQALQSIIDGIVNSQDKTPTERKTSTPGTPQASSDPVDKKKKDGDWWKKLSLEKQKKLYENTLHPTIKHVVDQYKHKLPKEDLKRFAKETAKKLVEGDYKHERVTDPTKISDKHQKTVKSYCKTFFEKAAAKHKEREARKAQKEASTVESKPDATPAGDQDVEMIDAEQQGPTITGANTRNGSLTSMDEDINMSGVKRKRDGEASTPLVDDHDASDPEASPSKRQKSTPPPPPPPPPPPADAPSDVEDHDT